MHLNELVKQYFDARLLRESVDVAALEFLTKRFAIPPYVAAGLGVAKAAAYYYAGIQDGEQ